METLETLSKTKARQLAIAAEMLATINNPALEGDATALRARMMSFRRQIVATTSEIGKAIAELDKDATVPMMETLG